MAVRSFLCLVLGILVVSSGTSVHADPPWSRLIPFRRVEADPRQRYELTDENGPWLVFAASFAGPGAEEQAHELVMELRSRFGLLAYQYSQHYDFSEPVEGLGLDPYGGRKMMRHARDVSFNEIAVLVGDFATADDSETQKVLDEIKHLHPECLDIHSAEGRQSTQRFAGLRELHRRLNMDQGSRDLGPMRRAFVARNPLIPREFFVSQGIDPFVVELNERVEHSLMDSPGAYTVKVATFRGKSIFVGEEERDRSSRRSRFGLPLGDEPHELEIAADNAHNLTVALREQGVEAYEFHDRFESIVTVGSFDSVGYPREDGKIEINPEILRIMQTFGAQRQSIPGQPDLGLRPRTMNGIPFDVQPIPVMVPRPSIVSRYRTD